MQVEIWHNNRLTTVEIEYTTHTGLAHSDQYENYETFTDVELNEVLIDGHNVLPYISNDIRSNVISVVDEADACGDNYGTINL